MNTYLEAIRESEPDRYCVGSGNADGMFWPKGAALENFEINYSWEFCSRTGPFHAQGMDPHVHVGDELLVFVGLDPTRPQYLGATLDIYMGEDERSGHKQELYTIDTPTIVICPSTFPHCPLIVKKVDTPYSFFLIRRDKGLRPNPDKDAKGYRIQ
jgi:hypothetical protein